MPDPVDMHVPCPDEATARALSAAAVEARLAACANFFGPVKSVFQWKGAIESEEEWFLSLKSRAGRVEALAALVRDRHPYEVPAITWAAMGADAATAQWIDAETAERG